MILSTLLLASILSAGPEQPITPPVADASPYNQQLQDVDTSGDLALAVWEDGDALAGARIDRDGNVLDEQPLILSTEHTDAARVVRGDGKWLVTWIASGDVMRRFVHDDGTMDPAVTVASAVNVSGGFDAAFDGRNFLVAWSSGDRISALRLDAAGTLLDHSLAIPARGRFDDLHAAALSGGGGFALGAIQVMQTEDNIVVDSTVELFRLDTNAELLSSTVLYRTTASPLQSLELAVDGGTIIAAWTDFGSENIFVAREGQPAHIVTSGPVLQALVAGGGAVYLVAGNPFDATTLLLAEDGTPARTLGAASQAAAASSFGDRIVLALNDSLGLETDISTAVLDATLHDVAPRRRLTFAPALQERPAVARNAFGEALVAWVESGRPDTAKVMAARLDARGVPIGNAFVVAPLGAIVSDVRPQVVSDGSGYLVAWHAWDGKGVRAWRVSREGTVLGGPAFIPFQVYEAREFCAAWTGTEYVIGDAHIINQGRGGARTAEIRVTPVTTEGAVGETRVVIPRVDFFENLACGAGEGGTLVVAAGYDVLGVVIDRNGIATSPVEIGGTAPMAGLWDDIRPAVAANGRSFLVAWSTFMRQIEWAVVNEHATVMHSFESQPLDAQAFDGMKSLAVAPRGDGYVLAWGVNDLRTLAIDASGHGFTAGSISVTPLGDREPALAGGGSDALSVYTRDIGGALNPQWRVFARTLEEVGTSRRRSARH